VITLQVAAYSLPVVLEYGGHPLQIRGLGLLVTRCWINCLETNTGYGMVEQSVESSLQVAVRSDPPAGTSLRENPFHR